jgi:hypothetical protein
MELTNSKQTTMAWVTKRLSQIKPNQSRSAPRTKIESLTQPSWLMAVYFNYHVEAACFILLVCTCARHMVDRMELPSIVTLARKLGPSARVHKISYGVSFLPFQEHPSLLLVFISRSKNRTTSNNNNNNNNSKKMPIRSPSEPLGPQLRHLFVLWIEPTLSHITYSYHTFFTAAATSRWSLPYYLALTWRHWKMTPEASDKIVQVSSPHHACVSDYTAKNISVHLWNEQYLATAATKTHTKICFWVPRGSLPYESHCWKSSPHSSHYVILWPIVIIVTLERPWRRMATWWSKEVSNVSRYPDDRNWIFIYAISPTSRTWTKTTKAQISVYYHQFMFPFTSHLFVNSSHIQRFS